MGGCLQKTRTGTCYVPAWARVLSYINVFSLQQTHSGEVYRHAHLPDEGIKVWRDAAFCPRLCSSPGASQHLGQVWDLVLLIVCDKISQP